MAVAKDVMTAKILTLESSMDIPDVANFFMEKKVTSMPVLSAQKEVLGLLTEMALVRAIVLNQIQGDKYKKLAHCQDFLEEPCFVSPGDQMAKVISAMLASPSHRAIVINDREEPVGIISPKDLLRTLKGGQPAAQSIQKEVKKVDTAEK